MSLNAVDEHFSFPKKEEEILSFWKSIDAFETQNELAKDRPNFTFLDGPPFATGLPHYGHMLTSTIKDIVLRMAWSRGNNVSRRFGWDCHGLPIEFEIDKKFNISGKEAVMKMGIDKYNEECRNIVLRFSKEWEVTITRLARWVDFKNDYKTMNKDFMESVWWVFKTMFDKKMVYRGFKVMPFSTACSTPLSNFEVQQNYKDVNDPSIHILFPLIADPETSLVCWTTTPWCLPSNIALTVNPLFVYIHLQDNATGKKYILLKDRISEIYKKEKKEAMSEVLPYKVIAEFPGSHMKGWQYTPMFDFYASERREQDKDNVWYSVVCDDYVSADAGTGVVSNSPAFGEDDYRVALAGGVITKGGYLPCHVDDCGKFITYEPAFKEWEGLYIKDADKLILKNMKDRGVLFASNTIKHSYPFCWRSDTPLIYKAVPSWFIAVEEMRDKLVENNKKTRWVPEAVSEKRFQNWLECARDWAVSRNRYWGTPIPIWVSDDMEEVVCVGSIEELKRLTNYKGEVTDLHRESIDHLTIESTQGKGKLRRISEVFDCWFESGSMPYAQVHYPFENKESFEANFPADFIAEGLDQTRGWFYTLSVISTALFDTPPFKNLIVNGLVLAADGKKMSKRLQNYPPPEEILNEYGADALRLYLINSPVVKAETLRFKKEGVKDIIKDVFLPWYNAYRFFVQNTLKYELEGKVKFVFDLNSNVKRENQLDQWILASLQTLIKDVNTEIAHYRLYTVLPKLLVFIDNMTNLYIRLNRTRLRGDFGEKDQLASLGTLFETLYTLTKLMSSFTPYLSETMYQNLQHCLKRPENEINTQSVHFLLQSAIIEDYIDPIIERKVARMQAVIDLGRVIRERNNIGTKYPLIELVVLHADQEYLDDIASLLVYVENELNVKNITLTTDEVSYGLVTRIDMDFKRLGVRLGKSANAVKEGLSKLSLDELTSFQANKSMSVCGHAITLDDVKLTRVFDPKSVHLTTSYESNTNNDVITLLDITPSEEMRLEGLAREIVNRIQKMRKTCKLIQTDYIVTKYTILHSTPQTKLNEVVASYKQYIETLLSNQPFTDVTANESMQLLKEEQFDISGATIHLALYKAGVL